MLCWFPCWVVRLKENNLYHTNFVKWSFFCWFFLDFQRHDINVDVEILHYHFCTTGGGAGV